MPGSGPNIDGLIWGRVQRLLNGGLKLAEDMSGVLRLGAYGEQALEQLTSKQHKLADEGSYFWVRSPTIGTGVSTGAAVSSLVDTTPYLIITNNNAIPGSGTARNIYLDYIKLQTTTAGTNGTNLLYATKVDNIPRWSSGGSGSGGTALTTVLTGPQTLNTASQNNSGALVYAGALTAVGGSPTQRILSNGILRTAITVVNDNYLFNFGGKDMVLDGTLVSGTNVAQRSIPHCPVCLPPQSSFLLYLWAASQTVASAFELEVGYVER